MKTQLLVTVEHETTDDFCMVLMEIQFLGNTYPVSVKTETVSSPDDKPELAAIKRHLRVLIDALNSHGGLRLFDLDHEDVSEVEDALGYFDCEDCA